jgi:hypothetical protein
MLCERFPAAEVAMRRLPLVMILGFCLAACASDRDPARYQFGVSGDRPAAGTAAPDPEMRAYLDWKVRQICTLGYRTIKVDTLAAENGKQIVDLDAQCNDYSPSLDVSAALANLF